MRRAEWDPMSGEPGSGRPVRILLQTTIPGTEDDWNIGRFSMLRDHLSSLTDEDGGPLYDVVARNRVEGASGDDAILPLLDRLAFDQLWLFAVDVGNGLSVADCRGITRFRKRGGGILCTRDHQDLGSSLCLLGGLGAAHFFHSKNPEPDDARRARDDHQTGYIDWPNYHSGRNGDYQRIQPVEPLHGLLWDAAASRPLEYFAAHPHEGAVGVPDGERHARVIATSSSRATGRTFNLVVAFERETDADGNVLGRGIAESSFHHFADYNWDPGMGAPSFVSEPPGDGLKQEPRALDDVKAYVRNLAAWLAPSQCQEAAPSFAVDSLSPAR